MSKSILTDSQKRDLIKKYQEEVVKLKYQLEKFEDIILELDKTSAKSTGKNSTKRVRRGRPAKAKVEVVTTEPKRRGRPPKAKVEVVTTEPKRRGRPPKAKVEAVTTEPKRRGRPAKAKVEAVKAEPKRRGRPAKAKVEAVKTEPKRRGRPAKAKVEAIKTEPKRRGRPAKAKIEAVKTEPKRRGRPRKTISVPKVSLANELKNNTKLKEVPKKRVRIVKNGYKLSPWDEFIINALKDKQHVLISKDLIEISKENAEKNKSKFDIDEVKNMLNRSLHKMANKRNDLIKTKFDGKGFAYALPNWINQTNKSLKKKYQRK